MGRPGTEANMIPHHYPTSIMGGLGYPDPNACAEKRVWDIGWGGSLHCARNAGTLPIDLIVAFQLGF